MTKQEILELDLPQFFSWLKTVGTKEGDFHISISDKLDIEEITKTHTGTIFDFITIEKFYCTNKNIPYKTFQLELQNRKRTSHYFLICKNNILGKYLYIECFDKKISGLYEAKSVTAIVKFISKHMRGQDGKKTKYKLYEYTNLLSPDDEVVGIARTPFVEKEPVKKNKIKKVF